MSSFLLCSILADDVGQSADESGQYTVSPASQDASGSRERMDRPAAYTPPEVQRAETQGSSRTGISPDAWRGDGHAAGSLKTASDESDAGSYGADPTGMDRAAPAPTLEEADSLTWPFCEFEAALRGEGGGDRDESPRLLK